jgi:hypothetical protein
MQISKNKAVFGMLAKSAFYSSRAVKRDIIVRRGVFAYVMAGVAMTKTVDLKGRGRGASQSVARTLRALSPLTERVVMVSSLVAPEVERRLREMAQADGRTLNAMIALILTRAVNA